uniref:Nitrogen fixation protein U n=1 Tax=cyanobacterium endosymbiont of Rhopalodia gibba TaxID=309035 RepID=A1KYJ5_9CYAN|nr:nitrogen fixation protein U [cyanobacterium endosymbiont of Rhopalodia gibba]
MWDYIDSILTEIVPEETIAVETATGVARSKSKVVATTFLINLQKITFIQKILKEEVKPAPAQDGGDVDLFNKVTLKGACSSFMSSAATLENAIKSRLRDCISPELIVISV